MALADSGTTRGIAPPPLSPFQQGNEFIIIEIIQHLSGDNDGIGGQQ